MDLQLSGKTALVTGSYRGTGQIIAKHLLDEGANVLVHGLAPGQAEDAVAAIGSGTPVTGDITNDIGSDQLIADCRAFNIDILVNNYGTADRGSWQKSLSADWIESYQKNVLSVQRMVQAFLPGMQDRAWGRIVNLGTVGSTRPNARMPAYYSAKGALATLNVSLAKEVADSGVYYELINGLSGILIASALKNEAVIQVVSLCYCYHVTCSRPRGLEGWGGGGRGRGRTCRSGRGLRSGARPSCSCAAPPRARGGRCAAP